MEAKISNPLKPIDHGHVDSRTISYSVGSSITVIILAMFYWCSRVGFSDNHTSEICIFVGISLVLLNLPSVVRRHNRLANPWCNELLLTFSVLTAMVVLSYLRIPFVQVIFAGLGLGCLMLNVVTISRRGMRGTDIFPLVMLVIFSLWMAGVCWRGDLLSPLFVESLALSEANGSSLDPLFHLSIAQMIKHYGTVTNGLHGLSEVKYHFLSHFIMARLSVFSDTHMIHAYNIGHTVIFPPLLFKFFLVLTDSFKTFYNATDRYRNLLFTLLLLGLSSYMPAYLFNNINIRAAIGNNSLFVSESYLLSILLLMTVMHTIVLVRPEEKNFNSLLFVFLPAAVVLTTLAKISSGYLLMSALGYLFLRLQLYKKFKAVVAIAIMAAASLTITYLVADEGAAEAGIQWMSYFYIEVQTKFRYFLLLFYFWVGCAAVSLFVIYLRAKRENSPINISRARIMLEVILIVSIAGFIPPATMRILGGSGIYFLEVQRWLALILFICLLPSVIDLFNIPQRMLRMLQIVFFFILSFNTIVFLSKAVKHNILTRTFYIDEQATQLLKNVDSNNLMTVAAIRDEVLSTALIDSVGAKVESNRIYSALKKLEQMDEQDHDNKMIYIQDYSLFHESILCYHYFYMIPSLTGFASFQGIDYWCIGEGYFVDKGDVTRTGYEPSSFCAEMSKWNIDEFYSYDLLSGKYELIDCHNPVNSRLK